MTDPALVEGVEKVPKDTTKRFLVHCKTFCQCKTFLPVGDGDYRGMIGAVEILVAESVAASPRRGTGVDARDDGRAQHHVGGGPRG